MHEVMASGGDTLMDTGDDFLGLATGFGSVLVLDLVELALDFCQSLFVTTKEARVFDELAIGQSREDFQANVNADFFGRGSRCSGSTSQEKQTNHLPVAVLRRVQVLMWPSTLRCRCMAMSPILDRRRRP